MEKGKILSYSDMYCNYFGIKSKGAIWPIIDLALLDFTASITPEEISLLVSHLDELFSILNPKNISR
ncbi:MAG: hypothetical protein IPM51_08635 [Sphingobacteriaceae bacterium]|nr:hypothetical protein [Sphingobacteriaceae bacterium]